MTQAMMNITPVRNDNLLRRFLIDFKTFFNSFPILGHKDNENREFFCKFAKTT